MVRMVTLLLLLVAAWLLWSGLFKPLLLGLGAFSCILVLYLVRRMDRVDRDVFPVHLGPGMFVYCFWLLKEIIKSNLDVARIVISPRMPVSPTVVEIDMLPESEFAQTVLGNSITLTPGTVTLDIDRGRAVVHALTREAAAAVEAGEMNRRVARLDRK